MIRSVQSDPNPINVILVVVITYITKNETRKKRRIIRNELRIFRNKVSLELPMKEAYGMNDDEISVYLRKAGA